MGTDGAYQFKGVVNWLRVGQKTFLPEQESKSYWSYASAEKIEFLSADEIRIEVKYGGRATVVSLKRKRGTEFEGYHQEVVSKEPDGTVWCRLYESPEGKCLLGAWHDKETDIKFTWWVELKPKSLSENSWNEMKLSEVTISKRKADE